MRAAVQPRRRRSNALGIALLFALLAAIIIFGFGAVNGFHTNTGASALWGWALLFAFFATPFLAGLVVTLRSGRIGAGTIAGLWDGLFVGIVLAAYTLLVFFLAGPQAGANMDLAVKQVQDQMAQQGVHVTITVGTLVTSLAVVDALLIVLFLIIGVILGLIGALIGKIFAPRY